MGDFAKSRENKEAEQEGETAQHDAKHDVVAECVTGGDHRNRDRGVQLDKASGSLACLCPISPERLGDSKPTRNNDTEKPHAQHTHQERSVKRGVEAVRPIRDVPSISGEREQRHTTDERRATSRMGHHPPSKPRMEIAF
jgi:hypothetical protein